MARISIDRLLTAIDVGTTKICVLVGQQLDDNHLEIIGIGHAPSHGLRKGVVVDVTKTIYAIRQAIKEAELMVGVPLEQVGVGVSGAHISSMSSHGITPIKRGSVSPLEVQNVLAAARALPVPEGQQILHVLPKYYTIDGQEKVHNPLGMHGIRLEVYAHIILGAVAAVQNVVTCCQMAGLTVRDVVLEQLASAAAVLSHDELELGSAVLDIGGGTADLAVYHRGTIRHTMVLPIAGNHFTNDLAVGLRTTIEEAERIKRAYGMELEHYEDDIIEIAAVHGNGLQRVSRHDIQLIVESRAREMFTFIGHEIKKNSLRAYMPTGLVLTGGGSLLAGIPALAERMFKLPVRIGTPSLAVAAPESLRNPMYATGYGLLLYMLKTKKELQLNETSTVNRVFDRMRSWVADFF